MRTQTQSVPQFDYMLTRTWNSKSVESWRLIQNRERGMEEKSAKQGGVPTDTNRAIALKAKSSTKALKIMDYFSVPNLKSQWPCIKCHVNLAPTVENCLLTQSFQNGPLHSVAIKSDWFAGASSSLLELQKFAYKFNAQLFAQKRQFKM